MNIFVLDYDPQKAAQYHHDKHVVKMVLESCQILSTAYSKHGEIGPYQPTHAQHPCVVWAAQTATNYRWLWKLGWALAEEYTYRYEKTHACQRILALLRCPPVNLRAQGHTRFPQCMPEQFIAGDTVVAYRSYYIGEKLSGSTWKKRGPPPFVRALTGAKR
jgi:hypothetical protein